MKGATRRPTVTIVKAMIAVSYPGRVHNIAQMGRDVQVTLRPVNEAECATVVEFITVQGFRVRRYGDHRFVVKAL